MPSKSQKILARMRVNKAGWRRPDFDTLYLGFGFTIVPGRSHDIVKHDKYPHLRDTLPRHREELGKAYATNAVNVIDKLLELEAQESNDDK